MRTVRALMAAGVGIALLLFAASPAGAASLLSIAVSPAEPQTDDAIQITVTGDVPSSCWQTTQSQSIDGNDIELNLYFQKAGEVCLDAIFPFSVVFDIGTLPTGTYNVNATAYNHPWCWLSSVTCTTQTSFDVTGPELDGDGIPAAADADGDGYTDEAEAGEPLCGNGVNEDSFDDAVADDGCTGGPPQAGTFSEGEFNIGTNPFSRCAEGPHGGANFTPSPAWPSDFYSGGIPVSTDKINILDLAMFVAIQRYLGTSPDDPIYRKRIDLVPGPGPLSEWINILDLAAMTSPGSSTGAPPMFGGERAFNGPACTDP